MRFLRTWESRMLKGRKKIVRVNRILMRFQVLTAAIILHGSITQKTALNIKPYTRLAPWIDVGMFPLNYCISVLLQVLEEP
jgi:hypothetical protein